MKKLSVIIPARNEIYLQKTIENVLENARGDIEIIAICDGYWPDPPIKDDPRVRIIHNTEARGQRHSINDAVRICTGDYIMKLDAHCAVDEGFDVKLIKDHKYEWTVVPRMYNLDIETFKPKLHKRTDYMFMGWNEKGELRAQYYTGQEWKRQHRNKKEIDETMCCMGPGWFMDKRRFWELGGCDEEHGHWGQQGIEVACKAWLSGGALMVNKKTWFAHWFRGSYVHKDGKKGFPYPISGRSIQEARKYSMDLWLNNKWPKQKRDFEWLINKFNPPTWDNYKKPMKYALKNRDELIKKFKELGFKKGAEIGVADGIFSEYMHKTIPDLELYSVDMYQAGNSGDPNWGISGQRRQKQYIRAKRRLAEYPKNKIIVDTSMNAVSTIPKKSLDFVYIDCDHRFNGVMADIIRWAERVRDGGIVSGHDYVGADKYGVVDAVNMYVKHNKKELFLTEDDGRGGHSWFFYK